MSLWRIGLFVAAAHAQQTQCVTKQLITPGDGVTFPKPGDTVSMQYTGTLASTGAKFDSSRDRNKEFSTQIGVGQVIKGWDQGVPQMSLGERATLRISAACGYGAQGSPPAIPANADLVFDVELLGLNGRRASATGTAASPARLPTTSFGAAPASSSASFAASSSVSAQASGALPRCQTASQCGHAISWDTAGSIDTGVGVSKPLCLCNPICEQWAGTSGILPCCPGLQETCLDPFRTSSDPAPASTSRAAASAPTSKPVSFTPAAATTSFAAPAASFSAAPASSSFNAAGNFNAASNSFGATGSSFNAAGGFNSATSFSSGAPLNSVSNSQFSASYPAATASFPTASSVTLPTCRPNSCGKGMASGVNSNVAVCACDVSCLSPGSSLPCCTSFREVCQAAPTPASYNAAVSQPQYTAPTSSYQLPAQQVTAPRSATTTTTTSTTTTTTSVSASTAAACALGRTKWAEQKDCDKKRWAIQNNKCNKVCPAVDPNAGIKYYPTGQPGKDACAAALAVCKQ